jgi:peptidoglycan/LPS O-acetylase OafA/YrhL
MVVVTGVTAYIFGDSSLTPPSLLQNGSVTLLFLSDFESLWSSAGRNIWINTWSVALEAQFYLYWSLAAPTIFSFKDKRRTLLALALLSMPSLWVKSYIIQHGYSQPSYLFGYAAPFSHLWKMMLGSSLTLFGRGSATELSSWSTYIGMATFAATLLAGPLWPLYTRQHLYYWEILSALASAFVVHGRDSVFVHPALCLLGRLSYPLYLYQDPLVQIVESTAATCIALAAATCSTFYLGEPIRAANKARRSHATLEIQSDAMV